MVKYLDQFYPLATTRDHLVFGFFLACAVICMSASATYHTLTCHSHKIEALFLRLDFVGIVVQILGNFISGVHMGFYCEPDLQKFYSTLVRRTALWRIKSIKLTGRIRFSDSDVHLSLSL